MRDPFSCKTVYFRSPQAGRYGKVHQSQQLSFFLQKYLLQLHFTISFWKWHVSGNTKGHRKRKRLHRKAGTGPTINAKVGSCFSNGAWFHWVQVQWAEPGADIVVPGTKDSQLGASRWQTAAYIQAVHPGGSYPQHRPEAHPGGIPHSRAGSQHVSNTAPVGPTQGC